MPIPDYQECMLPLLELLADERDHRLRDLTSSIADRFALTASEREETLPSGQQSVISNRVGWAKTYLKKAGLLANPLRGFVRITDEGKKVLSHNPAKIDNDFLRKYSSFGEFYQRTTPEVVDDDNHPSPTATPEESLETAYSILRNALADELLEKVKSCEMFHPQWHSRGGFLERIGSGYPG